MTQFKLLFIASLIVCCHLLNLSVGIHAAIAPRSFLTHWIHQPTSLASKVRASMTPLQTFCCLPFQFSVQSSMSKTTGNISVTANSHIFVDLLRFRSRSDVETNVNGMITKYSTLSFQSRETTINFNLIDNECRCTIQNHTSLERACVQKSNVLQQDTILDLDASKIQWKYSNGESMASGWVIRGQKMPQDECFPLSVSHNDGSGLVEEFFNMKSSVDESVFNIPSICPPVSACKKE